MNHTRDDVFAGAALTLDEDRDIGPGHLFQPLAQVAHDVGLTKYDGIRWDLTDILDQRTARICHCCAHNSVPQPK